MTKQMKALAGVAIFAVLALSGAFGIAVFGAAQPVQAQAAPEVTRSINTMSVDQGGNVQVTIAAANSGFGATVTETLPEGWSYVSVSPTDTDVTQNGQNITFDVITAFGTVTYTASAPNTDSCGMFAGTYTTKETTARTGSVTGDENVAVGTGTCNGGTTMPMTGSSMDVPDKPNKQDEVVLEFEAPSGGINAGQYITIILHEDFQVPDDVSETNVTLEGDVQGISGQSVFALRPANVTVDDTDNLTGTYTTDDGKEFEFGNDADWLIQIQVPDTYAGSGDDPGAGNQGLDGDITVTIENAAGIRAPKEAGDYGVAYITKKDPAGSDTLYGRNQRIDRLVELSEEKKGRGTNIEATAKGFEVGTVYFWRDGDLNNICLLYTSPSPRDS